MDFSKYIFQPGTHKSKKVIWILFAYSPHLQEQLRKRFPSATYSGSTKNWYLPDLPSVRRELGIQQVPIGNKLYAKIHPINHQALTEMQQQLQLKSYSNNTQRMYLAEFAHLLQLLNDYRVKDLSPKRLKDYFLYCVQTLKMSERKMNGKINAVKFYFEQVLHRPKQFYDIPRPKNHLHFLAY